MEKQSENLASAVDSIIDENNNIVPHLRSISYDVTRDGKDDGFRADIVDVNKKRILADYLQRAMKDKHLGKENKSLFKGGLGDNKIKIKSNLNNRRLRQMNKNARNIKFCGIDKFNRPTSTPASINRSQVRVLATNKKAALKSCDEEKSSILVNGKSSEIGQASKRSLNRIPLRSQKAEKILKTNRSQNEIKKDNLVFFEPENIYLTNDIEDGGAGDNKRGGDVVGAGNNTDLSGILGRMKQIQVGLVNVACNSV